MNNLVSVITDKLPDYLTAEHFLLLISLLTLLVSFKVVLENNRPYVVLELKFPSNTAVILIVRNVGNRVARDIKFELDEKVKPLLNIIQDNEAKIEDRTPFLKGISHLAPGETAGYMYFFNIENWNAEHADIFDVTLRYKRTHSRCTRFFKERVIVNIDDYVSRLLPKHIPE